MLKSSDGHLRNNDYLYKAVIEDLEGQQGRNYKRFKWNSESDYNMDQQFG